MENRTRTLLKQKELEQSMLNDHELRHKYEIAPTFQHQSDTTSNSGEI